jgi:hypothetical protein
MLFKTTAQRDAVRKKEEELSGCMLKSVVRHGRLHPSKPLFDVLSPQLREDLYLCIFLFTADLKLRYDGASKAEGKPLNSKEANHPPVTKIQR